MAKQDISDDEKELFRDQMRTVKPLKEKNPRIKTEKINPKIPPSPRINKENDYKEEYFLSDLIQEAVFSDTILSYSNPSLPYKRFHALKTGQIPWEARLDLHGLKTEEARNALCHFISNQKEKNARCLLIIHGKGGHLGEHPILKNLINRWLPQFNEVLAFHSALPHEGGAGAVYVLLKK